MGKAITSHVSFSESKSRVMKPLETVYLFTWLGSLPIGGDFVPAIPAIRLFSGTGMTVRVITSPKPGLWAHFVFCQRLFCRPISLSNKAEIYHGPTANLRRRGRDGFAAMKVGILGSGDVGQALGRGFAARGHEVIIGSRTPDSGKLKAWVEKTGNRASTGTFAQAAAHGDTLVLATLGTGAEQAINLAGPSNFAGKLLIDVTNPLDFSKGMPPGLFIGTTDSLGERIQRMLPEAKVVKCFNTVGNSRMVDPTYKEVEMLICGNDKTAKDEAARILKEFGWKGVIDIGGIEGARWLEALVPLWVRVGIALNNWNNVFRVLHE